MKDFDRTRRLSQYVSRVAAARPAVVEELERRQARAFTAAEMAAELAPGEDLGSRLRSLRERVMVTLAHRDLNGLASLDEVFETMSSLADSSIAAAVAQAHRQLAEVHGDPGGGGLIVAALGKLGGRELNVSSDVDLVFLYGEDGETSGARPVSHRDFFAAAGRSVIALLSEHTAEGEAFRVDMRLRPFGDSGPLVTPLAGLEDYFIGHARPWERYAWMKARVVAGPAAPVDAIVQPFVYRRYLDFGMLDALRDMHARIAQAAAQRRKSDDVKLGRGGIRELEFTVQLFQMVRGGREAALRTTSTREGLRAAGELGLLPCAGVAALAEAYAFLRKLEHRLQYHDDQQTQALPRTPAHQAVIAEAMGFAAYPALVAELDRHRDAVQAAFGALFERDGDARPTATLTAALYDPQATPDPDELADQLAGAGLREPAAVARRLIEYTRSRRYRSISAASRAKVERLLPDLIAAAAAQGGSQATALRLIDLIEAIDGRESYFSLLVEFPQVLERAARLMARSAWAARLLARHPILLDELTRAATPNAIDWAQERKALRGTCAQCSGDVEALLDQLRHYKQRQVLRLTVADLEGALPVMALSDELAALADVILEATLAAAVESVGLKPGPRGIEGDDDGARPAGGLCVVGYGKLGGKELGYGSDLDIIFVYDDALAGQAEQFARVAQRVNNWMTTLTAAGVLYDIDLRLRPDGIKGLMVSSVSSFREYQLKRAWTWEHQALTRARACAGDPDVGARFDAVRDEILSQPRDRARLFEEIVAMRVKMRAQHKADATDIKHIEGGIIDLEFCVQALVLADGPAHAQLRENKGNHTLLHRAGALGLIDAAVAEAAANAYLEMRHRSHQASLNDEDKVKLAGDDLAAERAAVKRLWECLFAR